MHELVAVAVAFLSGSIPFGFLLARLATGVDLRRSGSGNIGATNALRTAGWGIGLLTLLLDALKGVLGFVLAGVIVGEAEPVGLLQATLWAAPVFGHCYSPWLRFRGGKGVATAAGLLAYLDPRMLLAGLASFVALAVPTRYVSLGSVGSALFLAVAAPMVHGWSGASFGLIAIAALVVWRHRENLRRLLRGTERRFGARGGPTPASER